MKASSKCFFNLLVGGTHLFVFISGFLFYVVFYKRYHFTSFFSGKLKNLLIPYTILAAGPIFFSVTGDSSHWHPFFVPEEGSIFGEYVIPTIKNYTTGNMVWLHRFEDYENYFLSTLADTSFAIFFLHGYVIVLLERFQLFLNMPGLYYVFLAAPVVALCVLMALVAKRIFNGRHIPDRPVPPNVVTSAVVCHRTK